MVTNGYYLIIILRGVIHLIVVHFTGKTIDIDSEPAMFKYENEE